MTDGLKLCLKPALESAGPMSSSYTYTKWNKRNGEVEGDLPDWLMRREKPHIERRLS
jgi:hypothetical protein